MTGPTSDALVAEADRARLATLCAAAARLIGCFDWDDTAAAIVDVLVNLIGCTDAGIYVAPPQGGPARRFLSLGAHAAAHPTLATVGRAHRVPFQLGDTCVGALALFRLAPHKASLDPLDQELLGLLARHAAAVLGRTRP